MMLYESHEEMADAMEENPRRGQSALMDVRMQFREYMNIYSDYIDNNCYFHPYKTPEQARFKVETAYKKLQRMHVRELGYTEYEGMFLISSVDCTRHNLLLTMGCRGEVNTYRIRSHGHAFFSLQENVVIWGLDKLIERYRNQETALPCKLSKHFVSCCILPSRFRAVGVEYYLHFLARDKDKILTLKKLIETKDFSFDLDEKDAEGNTALHLACMNDNLNCVKLLLSNYADVNIVNPQGLTVLHLAAKHASQKVFKYLLATSKKTGLKLMAVYGRKRWTAVHLAASLDYFSMVDMWLRFGLPDKPRTAHNRLPLDLAMRKGHIRTIQVLKAYRPPPAIISPEFFLHTDYMNRSTANNLLKNYENSQPGIYIVRKPTRSEVAAGRRRRNPEDDDYVLDVTWRGIIRHYQIRSIKLTVYYNAIATNGANHEERLTHYYIDNGPYLSSLSHLIEHYMQFLNGLPSKITQPIDPKYRVIIPWKEREVMRDYLSVSIYPPTPSTGVTEFTLGEQNTFYPLTNNNHNNSLRARNERLRFNFNLSNNVSRIGPQQDDQYRQDLVSVPLVNAHYAILTNDTNLRITDLLSLESDRFQLYKGSYNGGNVLVRQRKNELQRNHDVLYEAELLLILRPHPNIVLFYGLITDQPCSYLLVVELLPFSVRDKLLDKNVRITVRMIENWLLQVATAMEKMGGMRIVFNNLCASNVMLRNMNLVKLGNFSRATQVSMTDRFYVEPVRDNMPPEQWLAPESIRNQRLAPYTDVWSFGVTAWEMYSGGKTPYADVTYDSMLDFLEEENRLANPASCQTQVYENFLLRCWQIDPCERPSFSEIIRFFQARNNPQQQQQQQQQ